jgi:hypothetical protein
MWCGKCYTYLKCGHEISNQEKGLDECEEPWDSNKREGLQVLWGKRYKTDEEFQFVRNRYHRMVPCGRDHCVFRKLKKRPPDFTNPGDALS